MRGREGRFGLQVNPNKTREGERERGREEEGEREGDRIRQKFKNTSLSLSRRFFK